MCMFCGINNSRFRRNELASGNGDMADKPSSMFVCHSVDVSVWHSDEWEGHREEISFLRLLCHLFFHN